MRRQIRYAVLMDALILADGRTYPAIVTDVSLGGAAIGTTHPVPAQLERFTLFIVEPKFELRVECEAHAIRELWTKRVIHARFSEGELPHGGAGAVARELGISRQRVHQLLGQLGWRVIPDEP